MRKEKFYPVTSVHKGDLRGLFKDRRKGKLLAKIRRQTENFSDADMQCMASRLADALWNCCYRRALEAIFIAYSPFESGGVFKPGHSVREPRTVLKNKQEVKT